MARTIEELGEYPLISLAGKIAKRYRIDHGKKFRLKYKHFDPADTGGIESKEQARELMDRGLAELAELQDSSMPKIVGRCC